MFDDIHGAIMEEKRIQTEKILYVEDNEEDIEIIKTSFKEAGFSCDVYTVKDGLEALQYVQQKDKEKYPMPDIIISDINMPKMDGYQFCRMLKFNAKYKSIPVILLTNRGQEIDKEMSQEVKAEAYICKDSNMEPLIKKIKELLGLE